MGSPRFVSPGAMAGNAIEEFLMKRALADRERQAEEFKRAQQTQEAAQHAAQLKLQQDVEARQAAAQQQQMADMERQRSFQRASTISENALPGDTVDDPTAGLLREAGFGGQIQQTQPSADALLGTATPGVLQMRGGSKYLNAQAQREATAANAEANRVAAAERVAEQDRTRKEIAGITAMGMAETRALRNQLTQREIDAADEKKATAAAEKAKTEAAARQTTQTAYDLASRLETHPGLSKSQGAYELRGFTQDAQNFRGIRAQLVAALALPNLGQLKGPMSDKDVVFVKNLATRLENDKLSEDEVVRAIREAKRFLIEKGATPSGGGQSPEGAAKLSAADLIKKYGR